MSCSGKSFMVSSWSNTGSYSSGVTSPNRYAMTRPIVDYARTYEQIKMPRHQYHHLTISNPVINYGEKSTTNYTGYVVMNTTDNNLQAEFNDKITEDLMNNLEEKIIRSRNGKTELLEVNQ